MGELKLLAENRVVCRVDNLTKKGPIDLVYYNVVFTNNEIILDYIHRSFRTWILRIKPYKELKYTDCTVEDIKSRSKDNICISYDSITTLKFYHRTFIKNAYMEIESNELEGKIRLFSRNNVEFGTPYKTLKKILQKKVSIYK